jgi:hypothetical protein
MATLLSAGVQKQVQQVLAGMKGAVTILYFRSSTQNREFCEQTRQLLLEVVELNDLLSLQVYDLEVDTGFAMQYGVDKAPGMIFTAQDGDKVTDTRMRLYGIPSGSEFSTLINDILLVSRRDSGLALETRRFLHELPHPIHLQVFATPT